VVISESDWLCQLRTVIPVALQKWENRLWLERKSYMARPQTVAGWPLSLNVKSREGRPVLIQEVELVADTVPRPKSDLFLFNHKSGFLFFDHPQV
jgi:hypothetical protein